jgi:hypothetical protein
MRPRRHTHWIGSQPWEGGSSRAECGLRQELIRNVCIVWSWNGVKNVSLLGSRDFTLDGGYTMFDLAQ